MFFASMIVGTVRLAVDVLLFLMFARAILSWLPDLADSKLGDFLFTVTEWVIMPVRALFEKMGWDSPIPIDIPFFVTFIILTLVSAII